MAEIVHEPRRMHSCGVNSFGTWWGKWPDGYERPLHDAAGTVRACDECGRTWVAYDGPINVMASVWRPEGRIARWWRERRSADG